MEIKITSDTDYDMIQVTGDIEMMSIKDFKTKLMSVGENGDKDISLDLSGVNYIDSSGVGVLITLLRLQKSKGKSLIINKVSPKVLDVLKLSSIADVFSL